MANTPMIVIEMAPRKAIALVAHDNQKDELMDWVRFNLASLENHAVDSTGTTGSHPEQT